MNPSSAGRLAFWWSTSWVGCAEIGIWRELNRRLKTLPERSSLRLSLHEPFCHYELMAGRRRDRSRKLRVGEQVNVRGTRWEKQCLRKGYDRVGLRTGRDKDTLDMVLHIRGMRGWKVGYMFGMARRGQWSDWAGLMFGNSWATWRWRIDNRKDGYLSMMDMGRFVTISGFRVKWSLEKKANLPISYLPSNSFCHHLRIMKEDSAPHDIHVPLNLWTPLTLNRPPIHLNFILNIPAAAPTPLNVQSCLATCSWLAASFSFSATLVMIPVACGRLRETSER